LAGLQAAGAIGACEIQPIPPFLKQFGYDEVHHSRSYACATRNRLRISPRTHIAAENLLGEACQPVQQSEEGGGQSPTPSYRLTDAEKQE